MPIYSPMHGRRRIDAVTPELNNDAYFYLAKDGQLEASTYNRWGDSPVYYRGEDALELARACGVSDEMLAGLERRIA